MNRENLTLVKTLSLPFLLSKPAEVPAQADRRWPVLCFLHGLEEGPPTEIHAGLTAHGPLRPGSSPLATSEFIVVVPQLPARGDLWSFHADTVCEMAAYLHAEHGGDRSRTYLTGFSFGGNGVFDIALHAPALWAALWPVDPTRVPPSDPGLPVWFSSGQASRHNGRRFMESLQLKDLKVSGESDWVYLDEGLDHVGTATSAYRSDRIYRWLLARHT